MGMIFLFILGGLGILGMTALVVAGFTAPIGYQDEAGFHYGVEPKPAVEESAARKMAA